MGDCFQFLLGTNHDDEEKPAKTKKFGPFQFDMRYLHSGPGLVKCAQVLFLWIAFFCNVIDTSSSPWESQYGVFVFFTISLALAALVSSYLLFTMMASMRAEECCGVSWRFVELLFYGVFGGVIFLGSCLAANKTEGIGNLTAAVAFSFLAVATFLLSFATAWKSKQNDDEEKKEDEEEDLPPGLNLYPESYMDRDPFDDLDIENDFSQRGTRLRNSRANLKRTQSQVSFALSMYDTEINQNIRRYSASDKDSAYSEGLFSPQDGGFHPFKMRRTSSVHNLDLQRYPLSQLQKRSTFHNNPARQKGKFNTVNTRMNANFPQQLAANSLTRLNFQMGRNDAPSEVGSTATQIPGWLRAALEDDDIVEDEKPNLAFQSGRRPSLHSVNTDFTFQTNTQVRPQRLQSFTGSRFPARLSSTMSNETFTNNFQEPKRKTLQFHPSNSRMHPQLANQQTHFPYS